MAEAHLPAGWFTKNVFNRFVAWLTRRGISVAGSRVLEVRGRKSGEWRRTPVNLLTFEDTRYLADDELRRIAPDHPAFRISQG
jgi:hypothetical protein